MIKIYETAVLKMKVSENANPYSKERKNSRRECCWIIREEGGDLLGIDDLAGILSLQFMEFTTSNTIRSITFLNPIRNSFGWIGS